MEIDNMIGSLHHWLILHPVLENLITDAFVALIFVPVSLYAGEIKSFVRVPPQRLGRWIKEARLSALYTQLDRLQRRHNDRAYQIASYIHDAWPIGAFSLIAILLCEMLVLSTVNPKYFSPRLIGSNLSSRLGMLFVCSLYFVATRMSFLLRRVTGDMAFEDTQSNAMNKIALLESALDIKDADDLRTELRRHNVPRPDR